MSKMNSKLAQLRAFQKNTDKSLQYFVDEAYRILGNPIIIYDIDWQVLAYAEGGTPFWDSFTHNGMLKQEVLALYTNEYSNNVMLNPKQVNYLDNEHLKHHGIFGKIYDKDSLPIACVNMVEINKPFEDDDLMVVKALCKLLSDEICKMPYYQNYSQAKLDVYIRKLINNDINDKIYAAGYIDMIYKNLKDNLYLAVADIGQCDPTYAKLDYYRYLFKRTRSAFKYSVYSKYIVIIMSSGKSGFYPRKCLNQLNKLFKQDNIKVGISSRFENLFELSRYYNEAVKALNDGLKADNKQYIFVYNDAVGSKN